MVNSLHTRTAVVAFGASIGLMIAMGFLPRHVQAGTVVGKSEERPDVLTYVEELRREDRKDRENAANTIRAVHAQLIQHLIQFAKEPGQGIPVPGTQEVDHPWHEPKHLAILLLGDLRASEAVPVLLENLEYRNPREIFEGGMWDKGGWYPAAEALSKIGMPAVDPTVNKLSELGPKNKTGESCCWMLKEILGVKLARARIQIAIEETGDETAKGNLKAALPYFLTPQEKAAQERLKKQ
jgi:hypothetical protein